MCVFTQLPRLTEGQISSQAVRRVFPESMTPYLPAETKLARHLDKQSLRGYYKRKREHDDTSESRSE